MPTLTSKTVSGGVLTIAVAIPPEELTPALERAAVELQRERPLAGFRPGRAPLAEARRTFGAMAILEAALRYAVPSAFVAVVRQERLLTVGEPKVEVNKLVPDQPVEFTASVAALPDVTLGDYRAVRVPRRPAEVTEQDVDEVVAELQTQRAAQRLDDGPAGATSRVTVDLSLTKGGVAIEGGEARDHSVDLHRPYYLPGFTEQLLGLKAGDRKRFPITFPPEHYRRSLAGQTVDCAVTVKAVYRQELPALDDAFAKTVGRFSTLDELRAKLQENLAAMKTDEEDARLERAIVDQLISRATFGDIPDLLVEAELDKMTERLRERLDREGGAWAGYLESVQQTPATIRKAWRPEALTRVRAALVVRAVGEREGVTVAPADVEAERRAVLAHYPSSGDEETRRYITSDDYAAHLKHVILTRQVMARLKELATGSSTSSGLRDQPTA